MSNIFLNSATDMPHSDIDTYCDDIVIVEPTDPDEDRFRQRFGSNNNKLRSNEIDPKPNMDEKIIAPDSFASLQPSTIHSKNPLGVTKSPLKSHNQHATENIRNCSFGNLFPTTSLPGQSSIPKHPSTFSTQIFEETTNLAQTIAPLNPLVAAVLVNCATVNLIGQWACSFDNSIYNTNVLLEHPATVDACRSLNALLPKLMSNFSTVTPTPIPEIPVSSNVDTVNPRSISPCPNCTPAGRTNEIEEVNNASSDAKPFQCCIAQCNMTFSTRFNLTEHVLTHTGERPFACTEPDCAATFKRQRDLNCHIEKHNAIQIDIPHNISSDSTDKNGTTESSNICSHEELCGLDQPSETSFDKPSPSSRFACTFEGCNKSYARRHRLNQHMARHTGNGPLQCDHPNCSIRYYSLRDLDRHKLVHRYGSDGETVKRRHICPYTNCEKAYSKLNKLKEHIRSHTGERPYTCRVPGCGASFIRLYGVRRHERTHRLDHKSMIQLNMMKKNTSSQKTRIKREVSKNDISKQPLTEIEPSESSSVMVENTENTQEIINVVEPVGKSQDNVPINTNHMIHYAPIAPKWQKNTNTNALQRINLPVGIHRPYVCPYAMCGKAFPKSNKLKEHICRHTGERPFPCPRCNSAFVRTYDLRRHMLIHTAKGLSDSTVTRRLAPRIYPSTDTVMNMNTNSGPTPSRLILKSEVRN